MSKEVEAGKQHIGSGRMCLRTGVRGWNSSLSLCSDRKQMHNYLEGPSQSMSFAIMLKAHI